MQTVQPIKDREKIEAIKKILRASSLRNELLFVLGINTGLRISDILSLKIADVSTNKSVFNRIELQEKKTKKKRAIALNKKTCRLIERYLELERPTAHYGEPLF
jgi:integrase